MGVVLKTNIHALIKKHGDNVAAIANERALAKLQYLGEEFVEAARYHGTYKDRTGNLRSSVGYVVAVDGAIEVDGFSAHNSKGAEGVKEAKKLAKSLVRQNSSGYVLICMAGMDYAVCLVAMDYDVIDTAEYVVRRKWNKLFKKKK